MSRERNMYNWQVFFGKDGSRETGVCFGEDLMEAVAWFRERILPTFDEESVREFRISKRVEVLAEVIPVEFRTSD